MIYMSPSPNLSGFGCPPARSGMGNVAALLVSAEQGLPSRELVRRGMAGMGDGGILDSLTGGKVTEISQQLDEVKVLLIASAAAAGFAGLTSLGLLLFGRR